MADSSAEPMQQDEAPEVPQDFKLTLAHKVRAWQGVSSVFCGFAPFDWVPSQNHHAPAMHA